MKRTVRWGLFVGIVLGCVLVATVASSQVRISPRPVTDPKQHRFHYLTVVETRNIVNLSSAVVTAVCPALSRVIAGGAFEGAPNFVVARSYPYLETQWDVEYVTRDGSLTSGTISAYATCVPEEFVKPFP
jgi:hypothetical protein